MDKKDDLAQWVCRKTKYGTQEELLQMVNDTPIGLA